MGKKLPSILLFGVLYFVLHTLQSVFPSAGGIISPSLLSITSNLGGGIIIGILFSWILPKTKLKRESLVIFSLLIFFMVMKFTNLLEGFFFTSLTNFSFSVFVSAFIISLIESIFAAFIFGQKDFHESISVLILDYFHRRKLISWAWRIILSSVVYLPVYFLFGLIISPFVLPYYSNPIYGLKIPPFSLIIPLELVRGFLYTATFLSLLAVFRKDFKITAVIVILILFIPGALVPLFSTNNSLPLGIVPFHTVEILCDSILYGVILTKLLFIKK